MSIPPRWSNISCKWCWKEVVIQIKHMKIIIYFWPLFTLQWFCRYAPKYYKLIWLEKCKYVQCSRFWILPHELQHAPCEGFDIEHIKVVIWYLAWSIAQMSVTTIDYSFHLVWNFDKWMTFSWSWQRALLVHLIPNGAWQLQLLGCSKRHWARIDNPEIIEKQVFGGTITTEDQREVMVIIQRSMLRSW